MVHVNGEVLYNAMKLIAKDVKQRKLQGKAVVVVTTGIDANITTHSDIKKWRKGLKKLIALDVVCVFAAGNLGEEHPFISVYPQMLAGELPIINVGAVDSTGKQPLWSQKGKFLTTSAGGVNCICATNNGTDTYEYKHGTSFGTFNFAQPFPTFFLGGRCSESPSPTKLTRSLSP